MSFRRYASYKDSGVEWLGEVPSGWATKPLKAVASWNDEVLPDATSADEEIDYLEISGVSAVEGITETTVLSFADAPSRARRRVRAGDVLISTVRTYLRAIAPVTDVSAHLTVSTGFAVIRPNGADGRFLGYAARSEPFIAEVISRSVGVSYPATNASDLVRICIAVPSPAEQPAIADFLDRETAKIDAMVEAQRRLISLLNEKRQAVISHAVTKGLDPAAPLKPSGVEWLGDVPAHWEVKPIRYLCGPIEQGWSPQCENYPVDEPTQWGVLKVGCVNGGLFKSAENKVLPDGLEPRGELGVRQGDLLISRANTRELVGSAAYVSADHPNLMISDKLYRIRFAYPELAQFMALAFGTRGARGEIELAATGASSSMLNIDQETISGLNVPLPPPNEVRAICGRLDMTLAALTKQTATSERVIALLTERRAALISAAVTGEIDIRGLVTTAEEVRDAVSAKIVHLHARNHTFGRTHHQKLLYLANAHAGIGEIGGRFARYAAGPHDGSLMDSVEGALSAAGVLQISQPGGRGTLVTYTVKPGTRPERARLQTLLGERLSKLDHLLKVLADEDTHGVEAVATLFAVWNDALLDGETPDDDRLVRDFFAWHREKATKFTAEDVRNRIAFLRRNALVPSGRGPHTLSGSLL